MIASSAACWRASGFHCWECSLGIKGAFWGGFPQKPVICQWASSPLGSAKNPFKSAVFEGSLCFCRLVPQLGHHWVTNFTPCRLRLVN
jgi:hypothetical protein